jgi:hypothetical protein
MATEVALMDTTSGGWQIRMIFGLR